MKIRLAFAGFGIVAQGLAELLIEKKKLLKTKYNLEWDVVAISDFKKGSVIDPQGLDLQNLLTLVQQGQSLEKYHAPVKGLAVPDMLESVDATMLVEATYTDVKTGQPATHHIQKALQQGWHVITTNKGPFIHYGKDLIQMAKDKQVGLGFEGVVMSGTPTIGLALRNLAGSRFAEIKGILNGTTNFILTEMEKGLDYATALHQAQKLGYAEADPTADVEGWDALGKIIILTNLLMDAHITLKDAHREGITGITPQDIQKAQSMGKRWKLIARGSLKKGKVQVSVAPEVLPLTDPLASVTGATNALTLSTDTLGDVTIIGAGAGKRETGYALLADMLAINRLFSQH